MVYLDVAELGRALTVVKVTSQVNGNTRFSGSHPPKNYLGDNNEIWHNWLSHRREPISSHLL